MISGPDVVLLNRAFVHACAGIAQGIPFLQEQADRLVS
jgi:hypothetical protein